jgi:hypothetical protein
MIRSKATEPTCEHIVFPATAKEQEQDCCIDRYPCDVHYRCTCGKLACAHCMRDHIFEVHLIHVSGV